MADEYYAENITGAMDAGIETGVYFFAQAITVEEAIEEAEFVLELLKENPTYSREMMANRIGKTVRTVQRALDKLSEDGKIKRIGKSRAGYWEVLQ